MVPEYVRFRHIVRRVGSRKTKRGNLQVRRTCDEDLSPYCRTINAEEKEHRGRLVDVFEAPLRRKDVAADLQLQPLLLSAARACEPQDRVLAGDHGHCKEALHVNMGGILLALEEDPLLKSCVVVCGGAVVSALTGCKSGMLLSLFCRCCR